MLGTHSLCQSPFTGERDDEEKKETALDMSNRHMPLELKKKKSELSTLPDLVVPSGVRGGVPGPQIAWCLACITAPTTCLSLLPPKPGLSHQMPLGGGVVAAGGSVWPGDQSSQVSCLAETLREEPWSPIAHVSPEAEGAKETDAWGCSSLLLASREAWDPGSPAPRPCPPLGFSATATRPLRVPLSFLSMQTSGKIEGLPWWSRG